MNIVMLDSDQLSGDVEFPDINLDKYGWQQYLSVPDDEIEERCWRADIVISTHAPITKRVIENAFKLKLIIAAGDDTDHIDHEAANARNIRIISFSGLKGDNQANTTKICNQVCEEINNWLEHHGLDENT